MTGVRALLGGGLFTIPGSTFVGGQMTSLDHQTGTLPVVPPERGDDVTSNGQSGWPDGAAGA